MPDMPVHENSFFYSLHIPKVQPAELGFPDESRAVRERGRILPANDNIPDECVDLVHQP